MIVHHTHQTTNSMTHSKSETQITGQCRIATESILRWAYSTPIKAFGQRKLFFNLFKPAEYLINLLTFFLKGAFVTSYQSWVHLAVLTATRNHNFPRWDRSFSQNPEMFVKLKFGDLSILKDCYNVIVLLKSKS